MCALLVKQASKNIIIVNISYTFASMQLTTFPDFLLQFPNSFLTLPANFISLQIRIKLK